MKERIVRVGMALAVLLMWPSVAMAAAPMPGQNLTNRIQQNITGAFPVVLAVVSLFYLVKRAFAAFIGFAVFAVIVAVFVYAPDLIRTFGTNLGGELLK